MHRRTFLATITAAAAAAPAAALAQSRAGGSAVPEAERHIGQLAERGIIALSARETAQPERARRLRALLVQYFDVPTIARFVIGRYWRTASEAERQEYMTLFADMLAGLYAERFASYQGEQLRVTGSRTSAEGDIFVDSDLARPGQSQPAKVDWVLRRASDGLKIVDVRVAGVSMAITQRDECAAIIQGGGGRFSALLQTMRQRAGQAPR
jgi:phospholipid transport system substrate-binding protein